MSQIPVPKHKRKAVNPAPTTVAFDQMDLVVFRKILIKNEHLAKLIPSVLQNSFFVMLCGIRSARGDAEGYVIADIKPFISSIDGRKAWIVRVEYLVKKMIEIMVVQIIEIKIHFLLKMFRINHYQTLVD